MPSRPLIGITSDYDRNPSTARVFVQEPYVRAVEEAGGLPLVIPAVSSSLYSEVLEHIDGLVLPGGNDPHPSRFGKEVGDDFNPLDPAREEFDFAFAEQALRSDIPILGICYGAQLLNILLGGDLIVDIPSEVDGNICHRTDDGVEHDIAVDRDSLAYEIWQTTSVHASSWHHQAVGRLGRGLTITGRAPDGVVEIFEGDEGRFLLGVQFHPERSTAEVRVPVFRALVDASKNRRSSNSLTTSE